MQGYCWILLCKEPQYKYDRDQWIAVSKRTQELRDKLRANDVSQEEVMDMMGRCKSFMDKPFEEMDLDQQVFFAGVVFI